MLTRLATRTKLPATDQGIADRVGQVGLLLREPVSVPLEQPAITEPMTKVVQSLMANS